MKKLRYLLPILIILSVAAVSPAREDKKEAGQPPAPVAVARLTKGWMEPKITLTGSVTFRDISDVSSEVPGIVSTVSADEGDRVRKGSLLVTLDTDLLELELASLTAQKKEKETALEKSRTDFERIRNLFEEESVSLQMFDDYRFRVDSLEMELASLSAQVKKTTTLIEKAKIRSPFDGVVIAKNVSKGEWVSPGDVVVTVGMEGKYEVTLEIPQHLLPYVKKGAEVPVKIRGKRYMGKIKAIVPRGNVQTRTFPLKISVESTTPLLEGEEALASLPAGEKKAAFIVDRNAVISMGGNNYIYTVLGGRATPLPVEVVGYEGRTVGISGDKLAEGMPVIIKGNERVRPGQPVAPEGPGAEK